MKNYIVSLSTGRKIVVYGEFRNSGVLSGKHVADVIGKNDDGSLIFRAGTDEYMSGWDYAEAHALRTPITTAKAVDLLVCVVPSPGYNTDAECFGITTTFVFAVPYGVSDTDIARITNDATLLVTSKGVGNIQKVYEAKFGDETQNIIIEAFKSL